MTRDDITRMAREAGMVVIGDKYSLLPFLEHFAALVAAAEREACANIDWTPILRNNGMVTWGDAETLADLVSTAIRARGNT